MVLRLLVLLLAVTGFSFAQEPISASDPGVTAPVVTHSVDPDGPHRFFSGKAYVVVKCVVDAQGMPVNVEVTTSGGKKYDDAAMAAVKQYRFRPAMKDGVPVAVSLFVDVTFRYGNR